MMKIASSVHLPRHEERNSAKKKILHPAFSLGDWQLRKIQTTKGRVAPQDTLFFLPAARIADFVLHTFLFLGKFFSGYVGTPVNAIAARKKRQPLGQWTWESAVEELLAMGKALHRIAAVLSYFFPPEEKGMVEEKTLSSYDRKRLVGSYLAPAFSPGDFVLQKISSKKGPLSPVDSLVILPFYRLIGAICHTSAAILTFGTGYFATPYNLLAKRFHHPTLDRWDWIACSGHMGKIAYEMRRACGIWGRIFPAEGYRPASTKKRGPTTKNPPSISLETPNQDPQTPSLPPNRTDTSTFPPSDTPVGSAGDTFSQTPPNDSQTPPNDSQDTPKPALSNQEIPPPPPPPPPNQNQNSLPSAANNSPPPKQTTSLPHLELLRQKSLLMSQQREQTPLTEPGSSYQPEETPTSQISNSLVNTIPVLNGNSDDDTDSDWESDNEEVSQNVTNSPSGPREWQHWYFYAPEPGSIVKFPDVIALLEEIRDLCWKGTLQEDHSFILYESSENERICFLTQEDIIHYQLADYTGADKSQILKKLKTAMENKKNELSSSDCLVDDKKRFLMESYPATLHMLSELQWELLFPDQPEHQKKRIFHKPCSIQDEALRQSLLEILLLCCTSEVFPDRKIPFKPKEDLNNPLYYNDRLEKNLAGIDIPKILEEKKKHLSGLRTPQTNVTSEKAGKFGNTVTRSRANSVHSSYQSEAIKTIKNFMPQVIRTILYLQSNKTN